MSLDPWYSDHPCPKCGKRVEQDTDCPGYPSTQSDGSKRIMVCFPPCGNAMIYECEDHDGCGWWWREPNRRGNTNYRGVAMGPKPEWSVSWWEDGDAETN